MIDLLSLISFLSADDVTSFDIMSAQKIATVPVIPLAQHCIIIIIIIIRISE